MKILVRWRVVHHPGTRNGKPAELKSVIFEEIVDGVHMSTRQVDHEIWEDYKARNLQGRIFEQSKDVRHAT